MQKVSLYHSTSYVLKSFILIVDMTNNVMVTREKWYGMKLRWSAIMSNLFFANIKTSVHPHSTFLGPKALQTRHVWKVYKLPLQKTMETEQIMGNETSNSMMVSPNRMI